MSALSSSKNSSTTSKLSVTVRATQLQPFLRTPIIKGSSHSGTTGTSEVALMDVIDQKSGTVAVFMPKQMRSSKQEMKIRLQSLRLSHPARCAQSSLLTQA